jgi:hypothetical protein
MRDVRAIHCLRRAERLRIVMLTTGDPVAQSRLRKLIHKYRELALRAGTESESPPLQTAQQINSPEVENTR